MSDVSAQQAGPVVSPQDAGAEAKQPQPRRQLSKHQKRRRRKRVAKMVLGVVFLAALAFAAYTYYNTSAQREAAANAVSYTRAMVQSGPLDVHVYGSGQIQAASQPSVLAEVDGTLMDLRVEVGDEVKAGQILAVLQNAALDEEIRSLEYALWDLDSTITASSIGSEVTSIKAPSAGRVKKLYAQPGDNALAVYREHGSVAILSIDGRMNVSFDVADGKGLALGDTVLVEGDGFSIGATITELYMKGTRAVATILDDTLPMDAPVSVVAKDGAVLGQGILQINKPMAVSAFGGTVREVRVAEGDMISQKYTLYTLEDAPLSLELENLRIKREAAAESLADAVTKRENLIILAPVDGVVASISAAEGDSILSGTKLFSLLEGDEMVLTIAVDELDVVEVEPGQPVAISVDALPDLAISGAVEKIAPVGTGSGGVSSYDVLLNFTASGTGVRAGMNASGEIRVAHADNTLYIPVEALMTINNQSFVLVQDTGETDGSAQSQAMFPAGAQGNGRRQPSQEGEEEAGGETQASPEGAQRFGASQGRGDPAAAQGNASAGSSGGNEGSARRPEGATTQTRGQGGAMPGGMQAMMQQQTVSMDASSGVLRAVTTGLMNDDYVEILSGLSAGEIVLYEQTTSDSSSSSMMRMATGGTAVFSSMGGAFR